LESSLGAPSICQSTTKLAATKLAAVQSLIGSTPLLQIHYRYRGKPRCLFAKLESMNMTGSIKDRMAAHILRQAYGNGTLKPGDLIVEATSGNTGISFSALGRALGHRVRIYMPSWMSQERKDLIRGFGAEIVDVSHEQGGFLGAIRLANEHAASCSNVFLPRQFDNRANCDAHRESTGPEIERQLSSLGRAADVFVAGVGTGGTVMGVGQFLRRDGRAVQVHPLEPKNSPTLSTGHKVGKHRIQGISDEFIPSICRLSDLDPIVSVWDGDAILMAQALARHLGLGVGISSGANFLGAAQLIEEVGPEASVVTVLCDSNKKYLSTDLCRTEPVGPDYMTPHIELESFHAIR
jgi:cysteine synthase